MPGEVHTIERLLARMDALVAELEADWDTGRFFLATYTRTTRAVGAALADGRFEDPAWVEEWDVVFADLYLDALEAYRRSPEEAPRPWRIAFVAAPPLPPAAHVLLSVYAHINYDPPQALLAVVTPDDFCDPGLLDRRRRDPERI